MKTDLDEKVVHVYKCFNCGIMGKEENFVDTEERDSCLCATCVFEGVMRTTSRELRELNKKIAELKGMSLVPRYSTNITIAWELFEEMPFCVLQYQEFNGKKFTSVGFMDNNGNDMIQAPTAPEAICRAWIKWKEEKKESLE